MLLVVANERSIMSLSFFSNRRRSCCLSPAALCPRLQRDLSRRRRGGLLRGPPAAGGSCGHVLRKPGQEAGVRAAATAGPCVGPGLRRGRGGSASRRLAAAAAASRRRRSAAGRGRRAHVGRAAAGSAGGGRWETASPYRQGGSEFLPLASLSIAVPFVGNVPKLKNNVSLMFFVCCS